MSDLPMSPFKARLLKESLENFGYELGNAAFVQGKFDEAVVLYNRTLEVKSDHGPALGNLARTLEALGRGDEAAAALRRAEMAGGNWRAVAEYDIGRVHEVLGRQEDALACFRRTAELDPDHGEALSRLLFEESNRENYEAAVAIYRRIAAIDPTLIAGSQRVTLSTILLYTDALDEALLLIDEDLKSRPGDLKASIYRCIALYALERYQDACDAADDLLSAHPGDVWCVIEKAKCLTACGRAEEAVALLRGMLPAHGGNYWVQARLAHALADAGRDDEALATARTAAGFDIGQPDAVRINLAASLQHAKRMEEALSVLEPEPTGRGAPWVHVYRGAILEAMGRPGQAADSYGRALAGTPRIGWATQLIGDGVGARRRLARARTVAGSAG